MCGIAGLFHFDPTANADPAAVKRMTDLLAHRGPDGWGVHCENNVGLGHRRLAILDLSEAGSQPMSSDDSSLWITYNGECYNYRELRQGLEMRGHHFRSTSDTEVVLHLYQEYGPDFLQHVSGMFALAIWDSRRRRLLLARDRLGIKPLYYYQDAQRLAFASELKAILTVPGVRREVDQEALGDFLRFMSIPGPQCIFRGFRKLPPGHYLVIESGGPTKEVCYWDVSAFPDGGLSDAATVAAEFRNRFDQAVQSHLVSDVPVGAFLSGGVDSSAVAGVASQSVREPLRTFCIAFKGFAGVDESAYARQMAEHCRASHEEFHLTANSVDILPRIVWLCDEPFAVSSTLGLYELSKQASRRVKVVLTGDGADEVFGGYVGRHAPARARVRWANHLRRIWEAVFGAHRRFPDEGWIGRLLADPVNRYLASFTCFSQRRLDSLLTPEFHRQTATSRGLNLIERYFHAARTSDEVSRRLYADLKTILVSEMLTKVDRMTMGFGLEARVPFLDHSLVEWAFRVPGPFKIEGKEGKLLVKRAMEPIVPRELLYRTKHGFNVPMHAWLRGETMTLARDLLAPAAVRRRGFFRPEAVERLLAEHQAGGHDHANRIFVLLNLELWHRQFVDSGSNMGDGHAPADRRSAA
jgi:asparagine synthase (glutamine-hydrolysing)